jgi:hypothetical protein
MFCFGYLPGVRLSFSDVSEPSVRPIFKDWIKKYPKENTQVSEHGEISEIKNTSYQVTGVHNNQWRCSSSTVSGVAAPAAPSLLTQTAVCLL